MRGLSTAAMVPGSMAALTLSLSVCLASPVSTEGVQTATNGEVAALRGAEIEVIDGLGHIVSDAATKNVAAIVAEFTSDLSAQNGE